jgi:two-component system OmpR family sensor kinase
VRAAPVVRIMTEKDIDSIPGDLRGEVLRLHAEARTREAHLCELRDAVAARDAFIAIAGHELRNPMGTILMAITHLLHQVRVSSGELPPWLPARVEKLEKHTRLFVRRATTLLDVARFNAGQVHLDPEVVDLSSVVQDVVDALEVDAARSTTPLAKEVAPGLTGRWDRTAMEQIVFNLTSNALKYGAGRPIAVSLTGDATTATLVVRDHGIGISEADRERIFEPFERAVTERLQGGFGLGLWITRQLVVASGGRIEVTSRAGEGSSFTVVLPRAIQEAEP